MFELFANNRVSRIGFFAVFLATIALDFAKSPIEKFIVHQSDKSAAIMMKDTTSELPVGGAQLPTSESVAAQLEINQKYGVEPDMSNAMAVAKAYNEVQKKAKAEGREPTNSEIEASMLGTLTAKNLSEEQVTAIADKSFFDTLYVVAALGLTGITIFSLIWLATGRIRDIGWSQWIAVAILSVYFVPLIMARHMPDWLLTAFNPTFLLLMIVIGLISSQDSGQSSQQVLAAPTSPTPRTSGPVQFGRRGSR